MVLRDIFQPNMLPSSSPPSVYFRGKPDFKPTHSSSSASASTSRLEDPTSSQPAIKVKDVIQPRRLDQREDGERYSLSEWLMRDEAIARCSIDQARSLRQDGANLFYLDTFPCRMVELVGIIIGIDVKDNRTTYYLDDGSSQTLELTYEHNCLQVFQQAQRMAEAQKRAPPSTYAYGPSTVLERAQPPPLPPAEHFPSVEVGDTVKVRARVKQWSANIHFVVGSDLDARPPNEEVRHIKLVAALTAEVYPSFSQSAYLQTSLAPRPPALALPSTALPRTPSKGSTRTIPSSGSSAAGPSSDLDVSDWPSSSQVSSSNVTPTKDRPVPLPRPEDVRKISSKDCTIDGLKLRLKDYMFKVVESAWGVRGLLHPSPEPPVVRWLPEMSSAGWDGRGKGKGRAHDGNFTADFSASFDVSVGNSTSFNSTFNNSSSLFSGYVPSSHHPSSSAPTAPPFTIEHFQHVPSLQIYGEKVLKRVVMEKEDERRVALKVELKAAKKQARARPDRRERWFYDEDGIGHEAEDVVAEATRKVREKGKKEPSLKRKLASDPWVKKKVRNLFKQCMVDLEREGEVVRVEEPPGEPPSPTGSPSLRPRTLPQTTTKPPVFYLPLCVSTLAPLLLQLLRTENTSLPKPGTVVNGTPAPFGATDDTLFRRLGTTDERWHFVTHSKVVDVLKECDGEWDLVEKQRGGWRVVGR